MVNLCNLLTRFIFLIRRINFASFSSIANIMICLICFSFLMNLTNRSRNIVITPVHQISVSILHHYNPKFNFLVHQNQPTTTQFNIKHSILRVRCKFVCVKFNVFFLHRYKNRCLTCGHHLMLNKEMGNCLHVIIFMY